MENWKQLLIGPDVPILDALKIINDTGHQIVVIADGAQRLLGTVSDGDIRRGILHSVGFGEPVSRVMNPHPVRLPHGFAPEELAALRAHPALRIVPVTDAAGRVVDLIDIETRGGVHRDNLVVIMAGGRGTRLQPLTDTLPKPMLPIGTKPILELIIANLAAYGFERVCLAVNYKAEIIREHFGNGDAFDVKIEYVEESDPLGTGGALSLLAERPSAPILVLNGDVLTEVNFATLMDFHVLNGAFATMCVREHDTQIPFGVIRLQGHEVQGVDEKPVLRHMVNSGIYVLDPAALDRLEYHERIDMTDFIERLIADGRRVLAFPIREYWIDVGRHDEYRRAQRDAAGPAGVTGELR
jgi:dTDP-glucose pyrophosphorylase